MTEQLHRQSRIARSSRNPDKTHPDARTATWSPELLRASMYRLIGGLLALPPSGELLESLADISVAAGDHGDAPGFADAWRALAAAARDTSADALVDEYHRLFIGLGRGEFLPYASWYRTGSLMGRPLARVRQDLQRLGIRRCDDVAEPEDHVSALCQAMALLIEHAGEFSAEAQAHFFNQHVDPWMDRLFSDLVHAEAAPFYASVGVLGQRFMAVERRYFALR